MLNQLKEPFQYKQFSLSGEKQPDQKTTKHNKAKDRVGTLKRIWRYVSVNKNLLFLVLLMVVISSGMGLLGPFLIGRAIDHFIVAKNSAGLLILLGELAVVYLVNSLSVWLQNIWMVGIAQDTVYTMRTQLFKQLNQLPIAFFDKRQYGEIMSRVTNDIENVSSTLNSSVIQIFSSVLTLFGALAVMLSLNPLLMLITLLIVPSMFLGVRWITRRTGQFYKDRQRTLGNLNGYIEETISGQRVVKMFSQEEKVMSDFKEKNTALKKASFWALTYSGFIPKLMNGLNNLSYAIIALVGGLLSFHDVISIGVIVIFAEYARRFTRPLNDLANQFNTLLSAIAGAERVFEILDEEPEAADEEQAMELPSVNGDVIFSQVSFSYEKEDETIRDINFHAYPGDMVALVGPTGAGKTTIINLLSRFYDLDDGHIYIDDYDISKVTRSSLRKKMGFVLQDSFLFQGTILENIRYGRLDADDSDVIAAAKLANADSFISKLPHQYLTVLDQDGSGISQGQKQLISIARAILAKPSILILDEATSSIDTVTELKIQEALQRLMKGRTSFVIAHRLNTIKKATKILVINDGRIIESGSHDTLFKEKQFYYNLYKSKLTNDIIR